MFKKLGKYITIIYYNLNRIILRPRLVRLPNILLLIHIQLLEYNIIRNVTLFIFP